MKQFSKRFLTMLLSVAMVFGLSGMTTFAAEAEEPDSSAQDEVATLAADGDYQEYDLDFDWYTNPKAESFTITSPEQLAAFSAIVNGTASGYDQNSFYGQTVFLGDDLIMNEKDSVALSYDFAGEKGASKVTTTVELGDDVKAFTPIGNMEFTMNDDGGLVTSGHAFEGTFDGQGHSIENLYVTGDSYVGLFGVVGDTKTPGEPGYGVIKDFTLTGVIECTGDGLDFAGAACAKLNAGGTIEDVINYAVVEAPDTYNVGGIVGFAGTPVKYGDYDHYDVYEENPSGYNTYVLRCANHATVHGYYKQGGIVGENAATVMYCYNTGWILPHATYRNGGWGGIAGRNGNNNTATEESVIAYCYNTGLISNGGYNDDYVDTVKGYAGIVGQEFGAKGKNEVYCCYNIGSIPVGYNRYNSVLSGPPEGAAVAVLYNNYTLDAPERIHNYVDSDDSAETAELERGIVVEEDEFKIKDYGNDDILTKLGVYFVGNTTDENDGYPLLRWQVEGNTEPVIKSLDIISGPEKVTYSEGELFDPTGMVVVATYEDGAREIVPVGAGMYEDMWYVRQGGYSFNMNPLTTSDTEITVSYKGETDTQKITVGDGELTGLTVTNPEKTLYSVGDTFDPTGMTITAIFNYGEYTTNLTTDQVTFDPGLDHELTLTDNEITVTYTLGNQTASATVTINVTDEPHQDDEGRYLLSNVAEAEWFSDQVTSKGNTDIDAVLTNDIDISGSENFLPIGNYSNPYTGNFDGAGYTLTVDIDISDREADHGAGQFSVLPSGVIGYMVGGTVSNLTVDGTVFGKGRQAGVVGYADGGSITNCVNNAKITVEGTNAGGIVGLTGKNTEIKDCINNGTIDATSGYVGGIVGEANGSYCTIANCVNTGDVTGVDYVGGVVGYMNSSTGGSITNCGNEGAITTTDPTKDTFQVGGIVGICYASNISGCYNKGDITGYRQIGGIAGQISTLKTMDDCYNTGAVTEYYEDDRMYYAAGGIAGYANAMTYTNVFNMGDVTGKYAGALLGSTSTSSSYAITFSNAYYLAGTAEEPYNLYDGGGGVTENSVFSSKTAEEIASKEFLDLINGNSAFKKGCQHPVLTWETDEGHVWSEVTWTWSEDYSEATASRTCTVCGYVDTAKAVITTETTAPTATKDGESVYTATATFEDGTVETDTKTEVLPATGEVDKTALREEYEADSLLIKQDYTSASWAPLEEALEEAKAVLDNVDATEEEVSDALSALQTARGNLKEIAFADISVIKDGNEVAVISGEAFKAAQDAAPETTFKMLRGSGGNYTEVSARFVLVEGLLGAHQPDENCGVEMNSTKWKDMDTLYIYYREDTDSYSMAVDGATGSEGWYNGVTTITLGHVYKDGVCEICGATESVTEPTVGDVEITPSVPGGTMTYDGSRISLTVSAEVTPGTAQVTYQWYKDGTVIEGAAEATLTLAGDVADSGTYKCEVTATNSAGTATGSGEVTVTIGKAAQEISFAEDALEKTVGDTPFTNTLNETKVDTDGGASITYKSSDETIATVDENGEVTILAAGEVTITAIVSETDNYNSAEASYTITIEAAATVDKTGLESEIDAVEEEVGSLSKDDFTEESWNTLKKALENAQAVLADESATQDDVDGATLDLVTAIAGLIKTDGESADKSGLLEEYAEDSKLSESDYTQATWAPFAEALANALSALNDTSATQDEVAEALTALQTARENLAPAVDKEGLEDEVNEVEKELDGLNKDAYTEESWDALQKALANAQTVLADENATQDEVNAALNALKEAGNGLEKKNGLYMITAGKEWGYFVDGKVDTSYTGFQTNSNGKWYVENGYIHFDKNSVYKDTNGELGTKGTWYYVVGNNVQDGFTGLADYKNENGWWYIMGGKVDFTHNGVDKNKNGWWYVTGGKVQFGYTGVGNYKNSNGWWYIKDGKVDFSANTVAKNNNGWWLVEGGKVNFNYTGVANYKNANGWWYVSGGKVDFTHNGVEKNKNGWWYVSGGKVNFNFTGIASNANGTWYLRGGTVQFGYSGRVTYGGSTYTVRNGKVS